MSKDIHICNTGLSARGFLQIHAVSSVNSFPVPGATVQVSYAEESNKTPRSVSAAAQDWSSAAPDAGISEASVMETAVTDSSGQTPQLALPAPPPAYSLTPESEQPYAVYNLKVTADGYKPLTIRGAEILPNVTAIQPAALEPVNDNQPEKNPVVIPDHTLFGNYPPKIAETEVKPIRESDEIVLSRVVIPQTIVVHDGAPTDSSANNYYVPYRDYIKNVASSEIYATWPQAAITANVLAIMSFTLNRVYTEWYRNQGYDFTITSSTAFDHKWIYGRTIYESISLIVDEIFDNYLSRPDVKQPILTQYCDGRKVKCSGWMTQWGSADLGERGYSPIEILRYYYGSDIYINTAEQIAGIPFSWPGDALTVGSSGQKVEQLQEQLNAIASVYTAIPQVAADGLYGPATAEAVRTFQSVFGLSRSGIADFATWYKISHVYAGITRIAELQ